MVGRKVRQGPLRFGTSAFFEVDYDAARARVRACACSTQAGYRGFAHVEFAYDARDDTYKLLEVNTRPPVWVGIAVTPRFDIAAVAYDDLCGHPPIVCRLFRDDALLGRTWPRTSYVSLPDGPPRRAATSSSSPAHYLRRRKARAVFAADDLRPALASLTYLRSKV